MGIKKHARWLFWGVVGAYVLLFLVIAIFFHSRGETLTQFAISGDAREYVALAHSLQHGHFSLYSPHEFFRTPGYPLLLALALPFSLWAGLAVQIFLVAASTVLIFYIGRKFFSPIVGVAAGLLYAFDPTTITTSFSFLSDLFFVFVLLVITVLILHSQKENKREAFLVGIIGGFFVLIRPMGLYILPLLLMWYVARRLPRTQPFTILACTILGVGLVLLPWAIRNKIEGGSFSLSTIGSYNFLFYNLVEYESFKGLGSRTSLDEEFRKETGITDELALRDFSSSSQIKSVIKDHLQEHIFSYAMFHMVKTIPYYLGSSIDAGLSLLQIHISSTTNISSLVLRGHIREALGALMQNPFGFLERIGWALFLLFNAAALIFTLRKKEGHTLVWMALIILLCGMLTGPVSFPRYRLPAEPFIFLLGCEGVRLVFLRWSLWKSERVIA